VEKLIGYARISTRNGATDGQRAELLAAGVTTSMLMKGVPERGHLVLSLMSQSPRLSLVTHS